jgi:outer membrane protein TolC
MVASLCVSIVGCRNTNPTETAFNDTTEVDSVMARVDHPIEEPVLQETPVSPATLKTITNGGKPEYWDVSLDEVIGIAMMNSRVLRDLGATVLRSPQTVQTRYSRAIQQSDPRFGMEAALSAFDAQLQASANFQDNNRIVNNRLLAGPNSFFQQDLHNYVAQITKQTATGAQLALRDITDYDHNNAVSNLFGNSWQTQVEGSIRQPLLQGGGLTFNRIAGPGAIPGVTNGVLVAKVNSDITAMDFEKGLRDYVSDVVNAYWDLYFSYRDLDAKRIALARARETWQSYKGQQAGGRESVAAEALAREQFYRFQSDLEDAIAGKVGQRTQEYNGVTGGVFRSVNGVQVAERRLRLLIGLPVTDGRTLRPEDDPEEAPMVFDWGSITTESLRRRPELRAQRLLCKRRELELIAARNYLAPRLDATGTYRVRGLGKDLIGSDTDGGLGTAYSEFGTFKYHEFAAGLEFSMPLGFRQGHAAVDNAEFLLARERALLLEQERQVVHDLSNVLAETDRAFEQVEINLNRYLAAQDALEGLEANRKEGLTINLEQLLDIQRRLTEAQSRYYQSRVEYAIALKNVHVEKGSILEYADLQTVDTTAPIASNISVPGAEGKVDQPLGPALASMTEESRQTEEKIVAYQKQKAENEALAKAAKEEKADEARPMPASPVADTGGKPADAGAARRPVTVRQNASVPTAAIKTPAARPAVVPAAVEKAPAANEGVVRISGKRPAPKAAGESDDVFEESLRAALEKSKSGSASSR